MDYSPWEFYPPTAELFFDGELVAPCSWAECERLAAGRPDASRWLAVFRADVEYGLEVRARYGSIWDALR